MARINWRKPERWIRSAWRVMRRTVFKRALHDEIEDERPLIVGEYNRLIRKGMSVEDAVMGAVKRYFDHLCGTH